MEQIMWLEKNKRTVFVDASCDVTVRIESVGKGKTGTAIYFRDNCFRKITNKDFIQVGMTSTRMYFKEDTTKRGYKLSIQGKRIDSRRIRLPGEKKDFEGEYKLLFDAEQSLWYIQKILK